MSVTFEAMLIVPMQERDAIRELNRLLHIKDEQRHQTFNEIDMRGAGGSKHFTTNVYAACFNHLTPDDVEDCICEAPWRYPQWVLYVRDWGDYYMPDYGVGDDESSMTAQPITELRAARKAA